MIPPLATYRLQFRQGMTFDRAARHLAYIKSLGVSHVYASPVFSATSGSTHGYDVTDPNVIDPVLGGRAGFDRFVARLKEEGLSLILDIVPNHMAASLENGWWRDVLEKGEESPFADYFDVDWSEPVTLPHLDRPFDQVVEEGRFTIEPGSGEAWSLRYGDLHYPLSRQSVVRLRLETGGEAGALAAQAASPARMEALHAAQHWRLIPWQEAATRLSYRRFFEIADLVGVRVEDPAVFAATHALILELVRRGDVQGLRIDHVDGLADPAGYLQGLRQAVGNETFIVVEKILAPNETLPADWPVSGTTGYEFAATAGDLLTSAAGLKRLDERYRATVSGADFESELVRAKTAMVTHNFAGEVERLVALAVALLPGHGEEALRGAIRALLVAFPVYRTYGVRGALSVQDYVVLDRATVRAEAFADPSAVKAFAGLLRAGEPRAWLLRTRFQQLGGPVMAKAMEDTAFYRYNRLLAVNEVGGEPGRMPAGMEGFHAAMQTRRRTQPNGLSATTTHDTKRGEDARMRQHAISEWPDLWADHVARWRVVNGAFLAQGEGGPAPGPNVEWMLYQALLGVLPDPLNDEDVDALRERFTAYALKAVREAKEKTSWAAPDSAYEAAVERYAAAFFAEDNRYFLRDFRQSVRPFIAAGALNSLVLTLLKIAAPGIPDFYQGAEGGDFSLVDPDNRREVDYGRLARHRDMQDADPASMKIALIRAGLGLRREKARLFSEGDYQPLAVTGPRAEHVVAFARRRESDIVVAIAPVLMARALSPGYLTAPETFWEDTRVALPQAFRTPLHDVVTGRVLDVAGGSVSLAGLLTFPVALLAGA